MFLYAGLLSESLFTGIALVLRSTPDYNLGIDTALLLQRLWATAIDQGQFPLGVALSATWLRDPSMPGRLGWISVLVGDGLVTCSPGETPGSWWRWRVV